MKNKFRFAAALLALAALMTMSVGVQAGDGEKLAPSSCTCRTSTPLPSF